MQTFVRYSCEYALFVDETVSEFLNTVKRMSKIVCGSAAYVIIKIVDADRIGVESAE